MFLHNLSQRHVSALSWAIFRLKTFLYEVNHTIDNVVILLSTRSRWQRYNNIIQPEDGRERAETCHWDKLCKNILVTQILQIELTDDILCLSLLANAVMREPHSALHDSKQWYEGSTSI